MSRQEPPRPDPDALLKRYGNTPYAGEARTRGKLRVYLGAAPGVGKTYAMLNDARRLVAEGKDVVVGFIETHGRAETAAQIGDLEVLPRLRSTYQGVVVEEPDIDAILRRKPQVVLIDELAHTNAPGSARGKRYQDVELLRDAGIDVISTLNIQHLASLQDVVFGITGVAVRESIPDRVLEGADLQLIDLPAAALIERLQQGKVYPPGQAQQALNHFFRPGNLTALREMALRHMAAGVEDDLTGYMHEHSIDDIWPAGERVLVLIDGHDASGTVLRNAWRLASGLHGELVAAVVTPPGGLDALPDDERAALQRGMLLAEDLGARVRVIEAADHAAGIAGAVREEHATLIVMRHVRETGWNRLRGRSLVDELLDQLDNVDIHLVEAPRSRA